MSNPEYSKGYRAGRKHNEKEIERLQLELALAKSEQQLKREDRIYFECLRVVLDHCNGWKIGDQKVNNSETYCELARHFANSSLEQAQKIRRAA